MCRDVDRDFEQTVRRVREIWYELGGRKTMSRVTTAEGVLETIYSRRRNHTAEEDEEAIFRGHPLAVPPKKATGAIFYGVAGPHPGGGIIVRRRFR